MNIERLIEFVNVATMHLQGNLRAISGDSQSLEIYSEIEAKLKSLIIQPMSTAPHDGRQIILITPTGAVSARYAKGHGWTETQDGKEYWGPAWICYDDAFQIEIEETPDGEHCDAKGWLPIEIIDQEKKEKTR